MAVNEEKRSGKKIASMLFAVQGLFEGVAAGIATGLILVALKANDVIALLPIIVAACCMAAFGMSFAFKPEIADMGKDEPKENTDK